MEGDLNQDMDILASYLRRWRLQVSIGKTVSVAYHLNNRETKREITVHVDDKRLDFQQAPKNLGVCLDRTLLFNQHLDDARAKVTSRVSLIQRLASTTWGDFGNTLQIPPKPWSSQQLNIAPQSGVGAHMSKRLTEQLTTPTESLLAA